MKKAFQSIYRSYLAFLAVGVMSLAVGLSARGAPLSVFIVGGDVVKASDPVSLSTVALLAGDALCTASLIADDIAVTAAHCVDGTDPSDMQLAFGLDVLSGDPQTVQVVSALANPGYAGEASTGKDQHDIAIVRFQGGIPKGYQVAKIMEDTSSLKKGSSVILAGYGITDATTHKGAGVLRKTEVKVLNAKFGQTEIEFDQTGGSGACHGDSGGPAFFQQGSELLLLALTNRGFPDNAPDDCMHDSVYTKISAYGDWIQSAEVQLRALH